MMLLPSSINTHPIVGRIQQKLADYQYRYATEKIYCHTDRTLYSPDEILWFSVYVDKVGEAKGSPRSQKAFVELLDPKGQIVAKKVVALKNGRGKGDFAFSASLNGGQYQLKAYTSVQKNYGERDVFYKDIQLQKVVLPRVLMKLDFAQESYGPGQQVEAEFSLKNLSNESLVRYPIEAEWKVKGELWQKQSVETDKEGKVWLVQSLPQDLDTRDVSLNLRLEYQELTESMYRAVPIELGDIDLQFLPEGGDLIEGKKGVLAFKATNEFGKGTDVAGYIYNQKGVLVDSFRSAHMGMGKLEFLAKADESYYAQIHEPYEVKKFYDLPRSRTNAFRLALNKQSDAHLHFRIHHPYGGKVLLISQQAQNLKQVYEVECRKGENRYVVARDNFQPGIVGFVLTQEDGISVSERLVFVKAKGALSLEIETDKERYQPREEVKLKLSVKDEQGDPVQASFSLAVVDEQNLSFADDKQANLKAQMLLNGELKGEVEEPNYYFEAEEAEALAHLDILMLTQGWRRFDWNQMLETDPERPADFADFDAMPELGGLLIDNKGRPQANSYLSILKTDRDPVVYSVKTDSLGRFVCPHLTYGAYTFQLPASQEEIMPTNIRWNQASAPYIQGGGYYPAASIPFHGNDSSLPTAQPSLPAVVRPTPLQLNQAIDAKIPKIALGDVDDMPDSEEVTSLDEVVVVGYATQRQQSLTSVEITRTESIRTAEIQQSLQGALSGVQVVANAGPGAASRIMIRGSSAAAYQNPLIVVDGVIWSTPPSAGLGGNEGMNPLGLLDPHDVSNITILKGSSAQALYGSRGSNGVILITTKSGVRQSRKIIKPQYRRHRLQPYIMQDPDRPSIANTFYSPKYHSLKTNVRNDFRKTVFWEGELTTDQKGQAEVSFYNPDQASAFRISLEGTDGKGNWLSEDKIYHTELPFAMKVIEPNWLSVGDQVMLPVQFQNNTEEPIIGNLHTTLPAGLELKEEQKRVQGINLAPKSARTIFLSIRVADIPTSSLQISFAANAYQEKRDLKLSVRRQGFPFEISMAGNEAQDSLQFALQDVVPGTVEASFAVFTDVYSELVNGSESILREPHGCFEQVSSSLYPNVLVLMLLQLSGKIKPAIKQKALKFIRNGYRKIKGYEISGGGFDLYGRPDAKMGLSAYGLMELNDMQKVFPEVSKPLIARTRAYLLQMRDGEGGFKDGAKTGYYGRSDQKVRNAYTVHALIEAGEKELDKELERVRKNAVKTQNPYLLALACRSYYLLGDQQNGDELMSDLLELQQADGSWPSESDFHTVTRSRDVNYQIETGAFAVLAMLASPQPQSEYLEAALGFIYKQRRGAGYFGSTQGTVLSLKAISAYLQSIQLNNAEQEAMVELMIDQAPILSSNLRYGQTEEAKWANLASYIKPEQKQRVSLRFREKDNTLPYAFIVKGYQNTPFETEKPTLDFETQIESEAVRLGASVRLAVHLHNPQKYEVASPMVRLGIPAGLSVQSQQLNDWVEEEKIAYYELRDGELHLYFRYLSAGASLDLPLDLKADIPGTYKAAASVAYPYYDGLRPNWEGGESLRILPR